MEILEKGLPWKAEASGGRPREASLGWSTAGPPPRRAPVVWPSHKATPSAPPVRDSFSASKRGVDRARRDMGLSPAKEILSRKKGKKGLEKVGTKGAAHRLDGLSKAHLVGQNGPAALVPAPQAPRGSRGARLVSPSRVDPPASSTLYHIGNDRTSTKRNRTRSNNMRNGTNRKLQTHGCSANGP